MDNGKATARSLPATLALVNVPIRFLFHDTAGFGADN
jgi:hypothetical protein